MRLRSVVALSVLCLCVVGCTHRADEGAPKPVTSARSPISPPSVLEASPPPSHRSVPHASLTAHEHALAMRIAKQQQRRAIGTFVGATAFESDGTPFDPGSACDVAKRFLNIRLVWKADANFTHSSLDGSPPDGPRKSVLITADPTTGHVCESGAQYRNVGAADGETLLYGEWPDPADG